MKEIITDEIALSKRALEIDTRTQNKEMREIILAIKDTMRTKELFALSAPAIGYDRRLFCINFSDSDIKTFVNPVIMDSEGLTISKETCTSVPGKTFLVPRNKKITVMYQDPMGQAQSRKLFGAVACVFQHEVQHLDGLLISDIGLEIDEQFDNAPVEEQEEVIKMYLESLDLTAKKLTEEINSDPELKQMSDGIDFMTKVQTGEIQLEGEASPEQGNKNE